MNQFSHSFRLASSNGNKYIFVDARRYTRSVRTILYSQLSNLIKKYKVDSALCLVKSNKRNYVSMLVFEQDGSQSDFCGNGSRVIAKYLKEQEGCQICYIAASKAKIRVVQYKDLYAVYASPVRFELSAKFSSQLRVNDFKTRFARYGIHKIYVLEMLEPHLVLFVKKPMKRAGMFEIGSKMQTLATFPKGINVNFVYALPGKDKYHIDTFERGVNNFTDSCGSGSMCVAALISSLKKNKYHRINLQSLGGEQLATVYGKTVNLYGQVQWDSDPLTWR